MALLQHVTRLMFLLSVAAFMHLVCPRMLLVVGRQRVKTTFSTPEFQFHRSSTLNNIRVGRSALQSFGQQYLEKFGIVFVKVK